MRGSERPWLWVCSTWLLGDEAADSEDATGTVTVGIGSGADANSINADVGSRAGDWLGGVRRFSPT